MRGGREEGEEGEKSERREMEIYLDSCNAMSTHHPFLPLHQRSDLIQRRYLLTELLFSRCCCRELPRQHRGKG